jgi:hypothetical protein
MSTSEKQLDYAKRYQGKLYRVPVYIKKAAKDTLQAYALKKGYSSLNDYFRALAEADSGIALK